MAFLEVKLKKKKKIITPQKGSFSKMIKCATVMSQDLFSKSGKLQKGKKTDIKNFFYLPMFFWDPASEIGKKSGSKIRDKHPGSATLTR